MDTPRIDFSSLQDDWLRRLFAETGRSGVEPADAARAAEMRVAKLLRELLELDLDPDRHLMRD